MKYYYLFICLLLLACTNNKKTVAADAPKQPNFLDSLRKNVKLTAGQVQLHLPGLTPTHTFIVYNVRYPAGKPYVVVILEDDDNQAYLNQHLITIDTTTMKAIDSKLVQSTCYGNFVTLKKGHSYVMLNDSTFTINEFSYMANDADNFVPARNRIRTTWQMTASGKMISLRKIKE
jgi:hypothetical protein